MRYIGKYQDGGVPAAPAPEEAPMDNGGAPQQDPNAQLQQMAQLIIEAIGPEAAMALAQMIMEMLQGGGGDAMASMPEQGGLPMMRRGGSLVKKAGTLNNGQAYFKNY